MNLGNLTIQNALIYGAIGGFAIGMIFHLPKIMCAMAGAGGLAYLTYQSKPNVTVTPVS